MRNYGLFFKIVSGCASNEDYTVKHSFSYYKEKLSHPAIACLLLHIMQRAEDNIPFLPSTGTNHHHKPGLEDTLLITEWMPLALPGERLVWYFENYLSFYQTIRIIDKSDISRLKDPDKQSIVQNDYSLLACRAIRVMEILLNHFLPGSPSRGDLYHSGRFWGGEVCLQSLTDSLCLWLDQFHMMMPSTTPVLSDTGRFPKPRKFEEEEDFVVLDNVLSLNDFVQMIPSIDLATLFQESQIIMADLSNKGALLQTYFEHILSLENRVS